MLTAAGAHPIWTGATSGVGSPEGRGTIVKEGMIADLRGIDSERASALAKEENARFVAERPRSMELGARARASMPRGVPMAWMDDLYEHAAGLGRRRRRRLLHRRRRPPLRGHVRGGHERLLRARPATGHGGRRGSCSARRPVPAPLGGLDHGRRASRRPLRTAQVAVHAVGDPGEHRGDPCGAGDHRPRGRRRLRRQVPRRARHDARRAGGRRGRARDGRPAAIGDRPGAGGAVQRRRGPGARASAGRRGAGAHRAGAHERRVPPAGRRLSLRGS